MKQKNISLEMGVLVLFLIFQAQLETLIPIVAYLDELLAAMAVPLFLIHWKKIIYQKEKMIFISTVAVYMLIGVGCGLYFGFVPVELLLFQALISSKFFLILFLFWELAGSYDFTMAEKQVYILCTVYIAVWELSKFIYQIKLTPWTVTAYSVFLLGFLLVFCSNRKMTYVMEFFFLLMILSTGKSKAYGTVAVFLVFYIWILHYRKQLKLWHIFAVAGLAMVAGWRKFYYYYIMGYNDFARSLLTMTGIEIAKDYFPLGTGFGTYASYMAGEYYSPLYFIYGLAGHREVGVKNQMFLTDTYWPSILGETGILGVVVVGAILGLLYVCIQRLYRKSIKWYVAALFVLTYMMISTISETGFAQPANQPCAILLGLILGWGEKEYEKNKS